MKILAISDIHGSKKNINSILINEATYDYIAIAGDFSKRGDSHSAINILKMLKPIHQKLITVHGNWDNEEVQQYLEEHTLYIHNNGVLIHNIGFFGIGGSNKTPMKTPVEYNDHEIYEYLKKGYDKISTAQHIVLLSHTPPKGYKDRTFLGIKAGSEIITSFLDNNKVDLCICGHIHEASGVKEKDNTTKIVNAASYKKGILYSLDLNSQLNISKIKT